MAQVADPIYQLDLAAHVGEQLRALAAAARSLSLRGRPQP